MVFFLAEISDKVAMPTHAVLNGVLMGAFFLGFGLLLARIRWWLAVLPLMLTIPWAYFFLVVVIDLDLRSAIISEYGPLYFTHIRLGFGIPYLTCLAAFPVLHLQIRSRLRQSRGQCRRCGYDLGGLEISICPECGVSF